MGGDWGGGGGVSRRGVDRVNDRVNQKATV